MTSPDGSSPEFSRPFDIRQLDHKAIRLVADAQEREALARRFDLVRVASLEAEITLERDGQSLRAAGTLTADVIQSCAVSAEDLPVAIAETIALRFVPAATSHRPDEEVELDLDELDEIEFTGTSIDLGEAVAQSLGLAIDPFATGPDADDARRLLDDGAASPFAALAALKKKD